jgi:hypothetical protein
MKVPGFTAEAAFYSKRTNYRISRTPAQASGAVELALWNCRGNFCCEWGYCIYIATERRS